MEEKIPINKITLESIMPKFNIREKTLIIGEGEVGQSLARVLGNHYEVFIRDIKEPSWKVSFFRVLNICYPYSDKFIKATKQYIKKYKPQLTIIHSTIPVGTTQKLDKGVVHSPVNGRHPFLDESLKAFIKIVAGEDIYSVFEAVSFLNYAGIKTTVFSSSKASELAKICCTSIQYALSIIAMKEIVRLCEEYKVSFKEVYTDWNVLYNEGYKLLGEDRLFRQILFPISGPIGGHCIIPNCDLLDDEITKFIKGRNKLYETILEQSRVGRGKIEKTEDKVYVKSKKSRITHKNI